MKKNPAMRNLLNGIALILALAFALGIAGAGWTVKGQAAGISVSLAIGLLYLVGQAHLLRYLRRLEKETQALHKLDHPEKAPSDPGAGWAGQLLKRYREKFEKKQMLDMDAAMGKIRDQHYSLLVYPAHFRHLSIILGLFGTVLGVTLALAQSGLALQADLKSIGDLVPTIQLMFATTLAGIASYVGFSLNLMIARKLQSDFQIDLEEWVEDQLLPAYTWRDRSHWDALIRNTSHLEQLPAHIDAQQQAAANHLDKVAARLETTLEKMDEERRKGVILLEEKIGHAIAQSLSGLEKRLAESHGQIMETAATRLSAVIAEGMGAPAEALRTHLEGFRETSMELAQHTRKSLDSLQSSGESMSERLREAQERILDRWGTQWQEQQERGEEQAKRILEQLEAQGTRMEDTGRKLSEEMSENTSHLLESHAESNRLFLGKAVEGWKQAVESAAGDLATAAERIAHASSSLLSDLEGEWAQNSGKLLGDLMEGQRRMMEDARSTWDAQKERAQVLEENLGNLSSRLGETGRSFEEASHLLRTNQAEMQASVAMLNSGLGALLERLEQQSGSGEEEKRFVEQLQEALLSFQDRANELLVENALKTQEILLEVLHRSPAGNGASGEAF